MSNLQEFALAFATAGVMLGYVKYLGLRWRTNYLRDQHTAHNNILIDQEKDIAELKGKMNAVAVDIAGLFILYGRIHDRVDAIDDHVGIERVENVVPEDESA